jgi:asparagine synthase (glutamine-hydrolysing)
LSIVDLTAAGHQPMLSPSGRYVIVFNGEIYNYRVLRRDLEVSNSGQAWRGHSDTEVLLAGIETWGLETTLKRTVGMFAIALWDREQRTLALARDRLGEKPLYYGWQGQGMDRVLLFGSELKALAAHPRFSAGIDRGSLRLLLRHNYIPAPWTIYEGIYKLPPACTLILSVASPQDEPRPYWDACQAILDGAASPYNGSLEEASDDLERLLRDVVARQMVADVPLGAFLSGGVDSSLLVALMQVQSSRPIKTFTIGTHVSGHNEATHAKAVARHLGTDHTELYASAEDVMAVIPSLATIYCEPFADSSQVPTYLVSRLARQHVTVSLSGDGGDELFAGYNRYLLASSAWRKLARMPRPLRRIAAALLQSVSPEAWDSVANFVPGARNFTGFGDKVHKGAAVLSCRTMDEVFFGLTSNISDPGRWVPGGVEHPTRLIGDSPPLPGLGDVQRMMALDAITYLPDDIMVKVDRAAMACSLETRAPYLDHRVFEFAASLPLHLKLHGGRTKRVMREVLHRYVPRSLIERPKSGFSIPLDRWLRGPLRDWASSLLEPRRLTATGLLNARLVGECWADHLSGHHNRTPVLWTILMFMSWYETHLDQRQ